MPAMRLPLARGVGAPRPPIQAECSAGVNGTKSARHLLLPVARSGIAAELIKRLERFSNTR